MKKKRPYEIPVKSSISSNESSRPKTWKSVTFMMKKIHINTLTDSIYLFINSKDRVLCLSNHSYSNRKQKRHFITAFFYIWMILAGGGQEYKF